MRTAIVFATDEVFAPFAKGLVLSLQNSRLRAAMTICMVDIGCLPPTRAWMKDRDVQVGGFARSEFYDSIGPNYKTYRDAQFCRPLLPRLFPGHDVYVWCDADTWIQDVRSLELIAGVAGASAGRMAIVPFLDYSYDFVYNDFLAFVKFARSWYADTYNQQVAKRFAKRAILSSGIFGCSAKSPIWNLWFNELRTIIASTSDSAVASHLAEQTALNVLLYSTGYFVPLEAVHNYNCHVGCARRSSTNGRVVIDLPPFREVGIVHLSYCSRLIQKYLDEGLLFDWGKYLSESEKNGLRQLTHHHGEDQEAETVKGSALEEARAAS